MPRQLDLFADSPNNDDPPARESAGAANCFDIEQAIADEWGIPLGECIRALLKNPQGEVVGRVELADIPKTIDQRSPLSLRIKDRQFLSSEIESWMLEE